MADLVIKEGDTAPALRATFVHQNGMPVNLAGATVTVTIRSQASGPVLVAAAPAAIVGPPADGTVEYEWQAGDTDTPGLYNAEWEVTWASGDTQTFPSDGYTVIEISADLVSAVPVLPDLPDYCWPIDSGCCLELETYPAEVQARAIALATQTLRMLTGYRVGGCPITVRPCRKECMTYGYYDGGAFVPWTPALTASGTWLNIPCGCGQMVCGCNEVCEIQLPGLVGAVTSVYVDGALVPPNAYRVDNGNLLVRLDGECWPDCQDMEAGPQEAGAFAVTYTAGIPVDGLGAYAAGVLACEFAKACSGGQCRLPSGVTSVARQGISFEIAAGAFSDGLTGIREVDAYVQAYNPNHLLRPAIVWTPDTLDYRVTTVSPSP